MAVSAVLVVNTMSGQKFLKWSFRRVFIQLSGFVDFYEYRNNKCLVNNPLRVPQTDFCEVCEDFDDVTSFFDNSHLNSTEVNFKLQMQSPFVVKTNSSVEHSSMSSVHSFLEDFTSIEQMSLFHPCQYESNWKTKALDHWSLVNMIRRRELKSVFALWENCAESTLKEFRRFYTRPHFLESNVQLTGSNWAFLCSDFDGKRFREIKLFTPLAVVIATNGMLKLKLEASEECREVCSSFTVTLNAGDLLVFSSSFYRLSVLPKCRNGEAIAVGVGGYAD